jgi:hypothetical protein
LLQSIIGSFIILCPEGVYKRWENKAYFQSITDIKDDDVAQLVQRIADDVKILCVRMGYQGNDDDIVQNPPLDPVFHEDSALYQATVHSIAGGSCLIQGLAIMCGVSGKALDMTKKCLMPKANGVSASTTFFYMQIPPSTLTQGTA